MGGRGEQFPSTIWSDILAAGADDGARLEKLCRAYWKPVYAYVRAAWRKPVEEAKDLTQAFFARLLEKEALARLRPERGSFRGYLKVALKHFLIDAERAEAARRPSAPVFSLDAAPDELDRLGPSAEGEAPEDAYDREWFRGLLDEAIDELERRLKAEGKSKVFDVFRAYCIDPQTSAAAEAPTYRDVAERLNIKETDISNHLAVCRHALMNIQRARIRDYVPTEADVERELRETLGG
jgi:RNA polymerase sigma-70 factor (ECF subfamily)